MPVPITDMLVHFHEAEVPQTLLDDAEVYRVVSAVTRPSMNAFAPAITRLFAYGLHPMFANENADEELEILRRRCEREEVDLIGEIGLDGRASMPDAQIQERVFLSQLALAEEFDLPVILHLIKTHTRALELLRSWPTIRGFVHGFTGAPEVANAFIDRGLFISLGPAILSDKNTRARRCATELPIDALLVESDSPSPSPHRGPSSPSDCVLVLKEIARLKAIPLQPLATQIERNVNKLLRP